MSDIPNLPVPYTKKRSKYTFDFAGYSYTLHKLKAGTTLYKGQFPLREKPWKWFTNLSKFRWTAVLEDTPPDLLFRARWPDTAQWDRLYATASQSDPENSLFMYKPSGGKPRWSIRWDGSQYILEHLRTEQYLKAPTYEALMGIVDRLEFAGDMALSYVLDAGDRKQLSILAEALQGPQPNK